MMIEIMKIITQMITGNQIFKGLLMSKKVTSTDLNLEVQIEEQVFQKIMHWVNKAGSYEVSGLGNVVYDKENRCLRVDEVWLLNQENSGSTTDIDENAVGKLMFEHHKSGVEGDLRFWWHSHASMGVFWSGTDIATIKELGEGGWFLNTVFNNKEEMRTCLYMTDPMEIFSDELETVITSEIYDDEVEQALEKLGLRVRDNKIGAIRDAIELDLEDQKAEWDAEYDEKIKKKEYTFAKYSGKIKNGKGTTAISTPYPGYGGVWDAYEEEEGDYWNKGYKAHDRHSLGKKESFPDYNPKKNKNKGESGWDGTIIINPKDTEDFFTVQMLEEIAQFRHQFEDDEIVQMYEQEFPNIQELIDHLDEQEEDAEA